MGREADRKRLRYCRSCQTLHRLTASELVEHLDWKIRLAALGLVEGRPPLALPGPIPGLPEFPDVE